MKKGPYTVLSSKNVYKNPWISITEEHAIRDPGEKSTFGIIDYGSGVSILALDTKQNVYLIKEYYYAIEEYALQIPSGGIESGETPLDAAKRELLEETGIKNGDWIDLGFVNPLTMILKSPAYLFLVKNCEITEENEKGIEITRKPFEEVYQMVLDSKINHAPTCVAILKAKHYITSE
jgi:ADP-ribose pyrophosphatase